MTCLVRVLMAQVLISNALTAGALSLLSLMAVTANAQNYPNKPITFVVPFGPGSGSDLIGRIIGQRLGVVLGQSVIIENKPGANGAIAAVQVARSVPDGTTIFLASNTPMSAAPSLNKSIGYDPIKDFTALCRIGSFTQLLLVHPNVPAKSVQELVAYAKTNPGKLSFASANASSMVAGETLKRTAGLDLLHVPYRSSVPAVQDVLGGRVSMLFTDMATGLPHYRSGALRGLATTRLQRSVLVPELPTLDESGVTGFDMDSWAAFFLPANTPRDIVTRLSTELRKIIDNPEVKAQIAATGFEAFSSSPEELGAFTEVQLVTWTKMIRDAGIQPE
jgi:tripartite-type tricarboxylate transporter receptor subunit TctC